MYQLVTSNIIIKEENTLILRSSSGSLIEVMIFPDIANMIDDDNERYIKC
jgi:hypothetical protein